LGSLPVVAVVNTNPDIVELLRARIEAAGFVAWVILHVAEIVGEGLNVEAVLTRHDPVDDAGDLDTIVQAVREAARARDTR
jgi:hypothetical protein